MKKQFLVLLVGFLLIAKNLFAAGDLIVDGKVGVGTTGPNEQIEITGNLRLPTTTSTAGILKLGGDVRFLHAYGNQNVFLGHYAGNFTMNGQCNTGLGYGTLQDTAGGYYNTAAGAYSLGNNVGGDYNTAVGYGSLMYSTEAGFNTAVGFQAMQNTSTGQFNTAVGNSALEDNTTGGSNIAVGQSALCTNTTGNDNIAIGSSALDGGIYGFSGSYPSRCIAIGNSAMRLNTGFGNIGIGYMTLLSNTSGWANTAVGYSALWSDVGSNNTVVGYSACGFDSGNGNSVLGMSALSGSDSGYSNSVVGCQAEEYNQIGSSNTVVGYQAGRGTGYHNKNGNVLIGYQAGYYETGSNKLCIDNSNTTSPLIWGDFSSDVLAVNGNLGVGTTNPATKLEVAGQVKITGGSPAVGEVLTSDANGLATWELPSRDISYYQRKGTTAPECWYTSPRTGTAMTTGAPSANYLRAIPFVVSKSITLDRIAINVTTLLAGNARLGIYSDDGNLYPGSLVLDAGTVDTSTTGVKAITISQSLNPGLYWLAIVGNAAPTIRCFAVASMIPILGTSNSLGTAPNFGYSKSYTYSTLPATFPASASIITAVPIPGIFVRLSN